MPKMYKLWNTSASVWHYIYLLIQSNFQPTVLPTSLPCKPDYHQGHNIHLDQSHPFAHKARMLFCICEDNFNACEQGQILYTHTQWFEGLSCQGFACLCYRTWSDGSGAPSAAPARAMRKPHANVCCQGKRYLKSMQQLPLFKAPDGGECERSLQRWSLAFQLSRWFSRMQQLQSVFLQKNLPSFSITQSEQQLCHPQS